MTELERSLRQVALDLGSLDRRFAVVGGLAVSIRAGPRLTRDVDVAVAVVDDGEAEEVINELRVRGYDAIAIVGHANADDLRALAERAVDADWDQAAHAAPLVQQRGDARNRDLEQMLVDLRRDGPW